MPACGAHKAAITSAIPTDVRTTTPIPVGIGSFIIFSLPLLTNPPKFLELMCRLLFTGVFTTDQ